MVRVLSSRVANSVFERRSGQTKFATTRTCIYLKSTDIQLIL